MGTLMRLLFVLLLMAALFSCYPDQAVQGEVLPQQPKVGLILGFTAGDNSFNDIQFNGLVRVSQEFPVNVAYRVLEVPTEEGILRMVDELVAEGSGLVFGGGVVIGKAFPAAAATYPQVRFVHMDGKLSPKPNLLSVSFDQYQGSYLAGALAARKSRTGHLLFIGGVNLPVIADFERGFRDGARRANPLANIAVRYLSAAPDFSGFENPDLAFEVAQEFFRGRGDVAYAAAGASGLGMIQAARESGKWAIGVDADQDGLAPGTVLASMMKRLDLVILHETEAWLTGQAREEHHRKVGLLEGGVSLSAMTYTKEVIGQETLEFLKNLEAELVGAGSRP